MTQDEYLNRDHSGEYKALKWCFILGLAGLITLIIFALL